MFVEAAGGVLVCGSLACAGAAVLGRRHPVAAALFAAALACAAADAFGAGSALHAVACALGFAGAVAMVLGRLGRPLPMPGWTSLMGGCAVGALAVTTGAELPRDARRGRGRGGARARPLARERRRWRARSSGSPRWASCRCSRRCRSVAAVWLREPAAEPGPEFSPVVLAAILAYAATALTLLVVGQFVSLPPVAATLATVTVLTGMARAGLTIVDRLRASHRQAVTDDLTGLGNRRHLLARLDGRDRRGRPRGRAAADRPRRLQGAQRHARASAPATRC